MTLLALLAVMALDALNLFISELDRIGTAEYGLLEALIYIAWTLPQHAILAMPVVFLLGALLGLGALAQGSEIIAIRAAGVSTGRIAWSALRPGVVLALFAFLFGELVAPGMAQDSNEFRARALGKNLSIGGEQGFWVRDADRFLRIRELRPDGALASLEVYQIDDGRLRRFARAATAVHDAGGWELRQVESTLIGNDGTRVETAASEPLSTSISPRLLQILSVDPEELSLRDLYLYLRYVRENGLDGRQYRLAWYQKLVAPASHLVMLFIALPFVFGPLRHAAFGQRLFIGMVLGLAFFLANRAMGGIGLVYGLPPVVAATLPTLVFFAGGMVALARLR